MLEKIKKSDVKKISFGGKVSDMVVELKNSKKIKIEVKATGKSAFEFFSDKDIKADYLIWLHFEDFFLKINIKNFKIFIIKDPKQYFKKPIKITIQKLYEIVNKDLFIYNLDIQNFKIDKIKNIRF